MRRSLVLIAALALLAGCNTMAENTYQEIAIETPDVEGVDCFLKTEKAEYRIIAPGSTKVERSPYDLTVTCEKGNYFTATDTFKPRIQMAWSAANVVNGVIPGTAWDIASRSIYDYPETITINMIPDLEALEASRAAYRSPVSELKKKELPAPEAEPTAEGDKAVDKALQK